MKNINKNLIGMGLFVLVFAFIITIVPIKVFAITSSPTISSIAPAFGIVNGGTSITITGTQFASGVAVTVGGTSATNIVMVSATQITATTPSGTAGAKDVVVTNADTGTITSTGGFTYVASPTAVNLGSLTNFAVFSNTAISNTGTTAITGDIGTGPGVTSTAITGFALSTPPTTFATSSLVSGNVYAYDYNIPTPTKEQNASSDLTTAYNNSLVPATTVLDAGACVSGTCNLGGLNLAPGVYTFDGSGNVNIATNLTLSGNSSAVWIFQIPGALNISSAKSVILSGGAVPANIFWAVAGTTTLQTTSAFEGNILAGPGSSTIAMQNGATLQGRALGQTNVSLISNTIVDPSASLVSAIGTAATTQGTSVITYTLTTGVFDPTAGIVNSNWTLGGANVADLGTISGVVLSAGNTVATVTVTGAVVGGNIYTVAPIQATFSTGFSAPATPTSVTVTTVSTPVVQGSGGGQLYGGSTTSPTTVVSTPAVTSTTPSLPNTGINNSITNTLPVVILGCDNRTVGFSTTTGQSCFSNTTNIIVGCFGTIGFSTVTGQTCSNNSALPELPMTGIAPTYDLGTTLLVNGSTGDAVMELQRFLNANLNLSLAVDGYLGPKTIAVVKQWQTNNGLVADGVVGVNTKLKMNAVAQ